MKYHCLCGGTPGSANTCGVPTIRWFQVPTRLARWLSSGIVAISVHLLVAGPVAAQQPTAPPVPCAGDCNGDHSVVVPEIIKCIRILLDTDPVSVCPACDRSGLGRVLVGDVVAATNNILNGCPFTPSPSPTPSGTPTPTLSPTVAVSVTPTPSATAPTTPSETATLTLSPTLAVTGTPTPTATAATTSSATATPTLSATLTDTVTPTATLTPTPIVTVTHTPSVTATLTPTATPTRTPSGTFTPTPTHAPRRFTAYVANNLANTVSVIDTATNQVIATLAVGSRPQNATVSPDGRSVYVTNQSTTGNPSTISIIGTATNTVVDTIPPPQQSSKGLFGVAFRTDGLVAYVTDTPANALIALNTATKGLLSVTAGVPQPYDIAVSSTRVYVTNNIGQTSGDTVSVYTTAPQFVTTVKVGINPRGIALSPQGDLFYVANFTSGTVSVVSTQSNSVLATIPVGAGPEGVAATPDGALVFVTNRNSSTLSVIDTARIISDPAHAVGTVALGGVPFGVAITPDSAWAYVTIQSADTVSVIDTQAARTNPTGAIVTSIPVGNAPAGIAIAGPPPTATATPTRTATRTPTQFIIP